MDHTRDPCPFVILNDFGGAFCMGAIGGTIWHGIKGFRNSPYGERRIGAITAVKMRAPVLGGNFGVWGGLFSTFDCAVKGIRKKEDPYNAIIAGFFTGGSLAIRGGYKAARNGAIGCAVLLAVIEGVGIAFSKMMAGSTKLEVNHKNLAAVFVDLFLTKILIGAATTTRQWPGHGMNEPILATKAAISNITNVKPRHLSTPSSYVPCSGTTPVFHTELITIFA
ncbi:translocase of the inner membrane [Gnomoniopsis smithogilvyi]|uniref:Translocase of the inner membrane n=1 Tax=Gnomoniopsis smithogilvyi TaxID=1191159 RepID=A0A9W8YVY3_9PEZI|nr:translocase of the inner membrane [Gnomoniopsis smithogilvyi]